MIEAIFYVLRMAVAWRNLSACYTGRGTRPTLGGDAGARRVFGRKSCGCCRATPKAASATSTAPTSSSTSLAPIPPEVKAPRPSGARRPDSTRKSTLWSKAGACSWRRPSHRDKSTKSRPPAPCWKFCGAFCWWATRASTATLCADKCWSRAAWLRSHRDRIDVLRPGFIGAFIGSVIRSKDFSSASKSISASPPVMKSSLSLS